MELHMATASVNKSQAYYSNGVLWWRDTKVNTVQRPMTDPTLPLVYTRENLGHTKREILYGDPSPVSSENDPAIAKANINNESNEWYIRAYNKAYSDLWNDDRLNSAEFGVSLAEGHEAVSMIVDRAKRLGSAWKSLKRGQFRSFLYFLGTRPKKRHANTLWTRPKDAASLWLEYWLGWAPLLSDIHASLNVITGPVNPIPITLSGKGSAVFNYEQITPPSQAKAYGLRTVVRCKSKMMVRLGVTVEVSNPNAYLTNQLGLSNPAAIAWAVVPFSFVVDWFTNVGKVLNGYTDFYGLKKTNQFRTRYVRFTSEYQLEEGLRPSDPPSAKKGQVYYGEGIRMRRTPGVFPGPSLQLWLPRGLSVTRGATAISLLVSLFTKG